MRTVNFRDDVLWAVAYKLGVDPEVSLLKNQAYAFASYINAWVRRLWDSADWPEWTIIARFAVSDSHIVDWESPPDEVIPPFEGRPVAPLIGKVLKVYLVDPRTTWAPVDTPFRLEYVGIHCGFEHGQDVWIKYVSRAPKFTAREWNSTVTYDKSDLAYSPLTGESYISKSSNNLGHDPSQPGGGSSPQSPGVEETPGIPDNPGLPATDKIISIRGPSIPGPPLSGSVTTITVTAADGVTILGSATHTASGSESFLAIFTILQGQLASALSGFTVTLVATPLNIRLENASDFLVSATATIASGPSTYPMSVVQVQAYVPATPPVPGQKQQFKLTLTEEQVVPSATYQLTFTTVDSAAHVAIYVALATDSAVQILNGLINAVITLQPTDSFFMGVQSTLDTVSPSATFAIDKTIGIVSLHAEIQQEGSVFWDLVPFPLALADPVVRGVYSDTLKESGQADKATPEEAGVPTEATVRTGAFTAPEYGALSDQAQQQSRYQVK